MRSAFWATALLFGAGALACARPAGAQYLYWLDTRYAAPVLRCASTGGTLLSSLPLTAGTLPEGLALDAVNRRLYVTEAAWTNASIKRSGSNQATPVTILGGRSVLRGVTVDPAGGKLYWTSSKMSTGSHVDVANLDGTAPAAVADLGTTSNPRGIAFHSGLQRLYFADYDQNLIRMVKPNGDSLRKVSGVGSGPYGLVIDPVNRYLYWTEHAVGNLRRANLDGTNPVVLYTGLSRPTYLTLDPTTQTLYWVESGPSRIRSAPAAGGGAIATLSTAIATYGGIVHSSTAVTEVIEVAATDSTALFVAPNPVRREGRIAFSLPHPADVRLTINDVQGRRVASLAEGPRAAGRHTIPWDTGAVPPGVYFAKLVVGDREWKRRVEVVP